MKPKTISTVQDVFAHFGMRFGMDGLAANNDRLTETVGGGLWACVEVWPDQKMFSVGKDGVEPEVVHLPCKPADLTRAIKKVKAA